MRVLILFDLPMETSAQRRIYRVFRRYLIGDGFMMLQKSVYVKLTLNATAAEAVMNAVRNNRPQSGLVQMMVITEKQFSKIEFVVGVQQSVVLDSTERLVII